MAKDVRWLQLQVASSAVASTRKQPAELQPPSPPRDKDSKMNPRRHLGSGFDPVGSSPFRETSQKAQEAAWRGGKARRRVSEKARARLAGQKQLTCAGWTFRMVNRTCSVRLLIDRLATLEPRTGPTRVWLSNAASCNKAGETKKRNKNWDLPGTYQEQGRFGVEAELDPAGLLLLLQTQA